ncbi:tRNA dihydrouridine synthase DusB [Desulfospira joergensenii]|uniref:tRNA dihydrouridine synthase DusB n=1 Tax=Desulfospira joergensenii TaxID=53329 RepID=UPI0003B4338B|nr:tRNA dihydrouridine synthase DusB [Desulfospira joergensenii]
MKIKNLKIEGKTFLAPLAGITNLPFRRLVKGCGCGVVCSEMVSAKGIFYDSEKTLTLMASCEEEKPLSVQIFGADPESMAHAAGVVEQTGSADILDINFGCSVKKVIKQGAGVALMKEPELSRRIIRAVRRATCLPFTIKIRSGWDRSGGQALDLARMAEEEGVDGLVIHPRTASQGFKGRSDWDLIRQIKEKISIPVIGNGDINSVEDAARMISQTGCDGVMIGRAAMADPFLPSRVDEFLATGTYPRSGTKEIFEKMEELTRMVVEYFGEGPACKMLRGRLSWFVKGLPGSSSFRRELSGIQSQAHALELILSFRQSLPKEEDRPADHSFS